MPVLLAEIVLRVMETLVADCDTKMPRVVLRLIWLDGGYMKGLFEYLKSLKRWREVKLEQVKRSDGQKGFVLLPKRWVVERTFAWLNKQRRLSKDYETLTETSEAMIYAAMVRLMLGRLGT